jgi:hypothetical protein
VLREGRQSPGPRGALDGRPDQRPADLLGLRARRYRVLLDEGVHPAADLLVVLGVVGLDPEVAAGPGGGPGPAGALAVLLRRLRAADELIVVNAGRHIIRPDS